MVPVAVSVPADAPAFEIVMEFDTWAFGKFEGGPRPANATVGAGPRTPT